MRNAAKLHQFLSKTVAKALSVIAAREYMISAIHPVHTKSKSSSSVSSSKVTCMTSYHLINLVFKCLWEIKVFFSDTFFFSPLKSWNIIHVISCNKPVMRKINTEQFISLL